MNPVDVVVVLTVALSAIFGLTRGLVHEIFSAIAWVGAIALTWAAGSGAARVAREWLGPVIPGLPAGEVLGPAVLFLAALAFLLAVGHGLAARLVGGLPGGFGRFLGLLAGLARGAFLVGYGWLQLVAAVPPDAPALREARTRPLVEQAAALVARLDLPGIAGRPGLPGGPGFPAGPGIPSAPALPSFPGAPGAPVPSPTPVPPGKPSGSLPQPATSVT